MNQLGDFLERAMGIELHPKISKPRWNKVLPAAPQANCCQKAFETV